MIPVCLKQNVSHLQVTWIFLVFYFIGHSELSHIFFSSLLEPDFFFLYVYEVLLFGILFFLPKKEP